MLKSDQEPAIIEVQRETRRQLWDEVNRIIEEVRDIMEGDTGVKGHVILENSPVGESQSNGYVENASKEIQQQIRKLKDQLQQNLVWAIPSVSPPTGV